MENLDNMQMNPTTFRDYIRVLFRHKMVIFLSFTTVMATVFVGLSLKTPVYQAHVKLLISAEKQVESPYYRELLGSRNTEVALTQSTIVKSGPVIERAVQALGLSLKPKDYEKQFASPIKSRLIDFKLKMAKTKMERYSEEQQKALRFRQAVEDLRMNVEVEPIRDTNLFTISAKEFDPIGAAVIANVVSRSYIIFDLEQQLAELTLKYGNKHPSVNQLKDSIHQMQENLGGQPLENVEAIGPASVKILEQASIPLRQIGPSKLLSLILAFFMSWFLGIMLAFVFEYMDQTFKSPQDIERELNLPFLGSIPRRKLGEKVLIKDTKRKTAYIHFYQILSDQLYLMIKDKKLKSILVTSAEGHEGTSTIIANLGRYLSQKARHKVLLIDANLRKSSLDKILKVKAPGGLADVLEEKLPLDAVVTEVSDLLHIVAAGHTELNPVILFDSAKIAEIIKEAQSKYEIILIDCPHLKSYKDSLILAENVDGTAVVVNEGKTRRQVVKNAIHPLQDRGVPILGVILNNRTFPIPKMIYDRV